MYRKWDSSIFETLNLKNNANIKNEICSSFPKFIKSPKLKSLKLEECNSIGKQISYYRVTQDMTIQMLADKCKLSKEVIKKAELEDYIRNNKKTRFI